MIERIRRSMDMRFSTSGDMNPELYLQQEYATEITQSLEPFRNTPYAIKEGLPNEPSSYDELLDLQKKRIQDVPVRKTNFAITFAPPAAGKSHESNHWMVQLLETATKEGGALL